jgi:hypothetical protein
MQGAIHPPFSLSFYVLGSKRTFKIAPARPHKKRMGRGRGATPRSARPRAGVDGSPAPCGIAAPGSRHTSSRSPWGGRSSAHPIACATFCFWRGKGGACERRSWRGGARSPAAAAPAASRPISIITGSGKFRTNRVSWTPITRELSRFRALRQSQARFRDLWTAGGPTARRHPPKK